MIESGGRKAELLGVTLEDFDLSRKTIRVLGKGKRPRLIPISGQLVHVVDEYLLTPYPLLGREPVPTDFLWFGAKRVGARLISITPERQFSNRGFHEWWVRIEKAAGVRHRKPHMTRHTYATDVLDATEGNIYAVKELLGHSSVRVTETYLHSSRTQTQAAVAALATYRRRGGG